MPVFSSGGVKLKGRETCFDKVPNVELVRGRDDYVWSTLPTIQPEARLMQSIRLRGYISDPHAREIAASDLSFI